MTRNSRSMARSFNAAMEGIGRAMRSEYQCMGSKRFQVGAPK